MENKHKKESTKSNQSLEKGLLIVETLAKHQQPMRLQDISSAIGMPSSTALRFLTTLMDNGYVSQSRDTLRYGLTLKLCRVAGRISGSFDIRDAARGPLVALSAASGESACLAVNVDAEVVYIDFVDGPDSMLKTLIRIGHRAAMHSTGVGKVMLAHASPETRERVLASRPLTRFTEHTIADPDKLAEELERVREHGVGVDDEECERGARCIAAPIFNYEGRVIAAISVSGPVHRMTFHKINAIKPLLRETALDISKLAGFVPQEQAGGGTA